MTRIVEPDDLARLSPDPGEDGARVGERGVATSCSAARRIALLSSVSLFALATVIVPFEFDADTFTPSLSVAYADGGGDDGGDDGGGDDGGDDGEGGGDGEGGDGGEGGEGGDGGEGGEGGGHGGGGEGGEGSEGAEGGEKGGDESQSADDNDDGDIEAEPDEVVAAGFDPSSLDRAVAEGFEIKETLSLTNLGIEIAVFGLPAGLDAPRARARLSNASTPPTTC